jgi:hypothetical protein
LFAVETELGDLALPLGGNTKIPTGSLTEMRTVPDKAAPGAPCRRTAAI